MDIQNEISVDKDRQRETKEPSMNRAIYRVADILEITGFCRSTLYKLINKGDFPAPLKIGRASVWKAETINEWLKNL